MIKTLSLALLLSSGLYAIDVCGVKISVGDPFTGSGWIKNDTSFDKTDKNEECTISIDANKVSSITKKIKFDTPITPSEKMTGCSFGDASALYANSDEKYYTSSDVFLNDFTLDKNNLRFLKVTYKCGETFTTIVTICKQPGKNCLTVFNNKKVEHGFDAAIKKIEEEQNLKMIKSETFRK
jgi:hypothetical protein